MTNLIDADARYTVSATSVGGLLAYARVRGIATASIALELGLDETKLADPEARLSQALNHRVWERVAAASGDNDFGLHMAEAMNLDAFHVLGHLAANSATFGEALQRITAYSRLLHDSGRIEVEQKGDEVLVYPGCRGLVHTWPRQIAEFSAASVVTLARTITGVTWAPSRVGLKHARPASVVEHRRIFGMTPSFEVDETHVSFAAPLLALPVVKAQAGLVTFLDAYARDLALKLPSTDASDLTSRVRAIIVTRLQRHLPAVTDVASELAMTSRTLQRRLADEGTTFQAVLDDARRAYAERYVGEGSLSLGEVGFLLGFSDPSSFHRAFRRWTGVTPKAFRERGVRGQSSGAPGR